MPLQVVGRGGSGWQGTALKFTPNDNEGTYEVRMEPKDSKHETSIVTVKAAGSLSHRCVRPSIVACALPDVREHARPHARDRACVASFIFPRVPLVTSSTLS